MVRYTEEWFELLARAEYVVNNANFPFFFRKAQQQVYVQTWHGTPLKRIANDIADKRYFSMTYQRTMQREARLWDHLVSPSPYCSEILPRAFDYTGKVMESGYPRNDTLLSEDRDSSRAQAVRRRLGIREDHRVLLYAPTWRDSARAAGGHSKVLHLEPAELVAALPDTVVLVRGHANTAAARSVAAARGQRGPRRHPLPRHQRPVPGQRRPDHRLLLGDVRLRHARPADAVPGAAT